MAADKTSSSAMGDNKSLHPVYSVTNIQNKIRTLDGKTITYSSWVKLFTLNAKGYKVLHHIDNTPPPAKTDDSYESWAEIDAIVHQWIYATISDQYLRRVLDTNATAQQVWNKLKHIFLSNKKTRAAALEKRFTNLTLASCSSLDDYCQQLQELAEQLNDVDHTVDESRLVVQLVNGLPQEYDACASVINQNDMSWDDARTAIDLERQRQEARSNSTNTALVAPTQPTNRTYQPTQSNSNNSGSNNPNQSYTSSGYMGNNYQPGYRGRGRGGRRGGRNYFGRGGGRFSQNQQHYSTQQYGWTTPPPCPHPAQGGWPNPWPSPTQLQSNSSPHSPQQQNIYPQNPAHFHQPQAQQNPAQAQLAYAPPGFPTQPLINPLNPTELGQALQAINLQNDPWYMDSGASSHLTSDPGPRDGKAHFQT